MSLDADAVDSTSVQAPRWFRPSFTYHAFGTDECVEGYEDLSINVSFNAYDFSALLETKHSSKEPT